MQQISALFGILDKLSSGDIGGTSSVQRYTKAERENLARIEIDEQVGEGNVWELWQNGEFQAAAVEIAQGNEQAVERLQRAYLAWREIRMRNILRGAK